MTSDGPDGPPSPPHAPFDPYAADARTHFAPPAQAPTPASGRGVAWTALGLSITALVGVLLLAVLMLLSWGPWFAYGWGDDEYVGDYAESAEEYVLDGSELDPAVEDSCDTMLAAAGEIALFASPADGSASLLAFVDAGRDIVVGIDGTDDAPRAADRWRDDWIVLLDELEQYAIAVGDGDDARFELPTVSDGSAITDRMNAGSPVGCEVPLVVSVLDPSFASGWF